VLSWGKVIIVNSERKTLWIGPRNLKWFKNAKKDQIIRKLLLGNFISACTVMCRKDALHSVGGFRQAKYTPFVDYSTWLELSLIGNFSVVDQILGYWTWHEQQVSSTMVVSMAEGCKYAIDFLNKMPREQVDSLGLSLDELSVSQQRHTAGAAIDLGRIALISDKWKEARRYFVEAFQNGSPLIKLGAMLGIMCSYCKVDFEWVATIMDKPRFK
jgi:hypothetical protein